MMCRDDAVAVMLLCHFNEGFVSLFPRHVFHVARSRIDLQISLFKREVELHSKLLGPLCVELSIVTQVMLHMADDQV